MSHMRVRLPEVEWVPDQCDVTDAAGRVCILGPGHTVGHVFEHPDPRLAS